MAGLWRGLQSFRWLNGGGGHSGLDAAGLGIEALVAIVENSVDPIMISGDAGEVFYANAAYLALADDSSEHFTAPGVAALFQGDGQNGALYRLQKSVRDKVTIEAELYQGAGPDQCIFDVRVTPLGMGKVASCWTFRRRQVAAAPPPAKNEIIDIIDMAPVGFVIVRAGGSIVFANQMFSKWTGVGRDQIRAGAQFISDLVEGLPKIDQPGKSVADMGITRAVVRGAGGAYIPVSLIYVIQPDAAGNASEMHLILRDLRDQDAVDLADAGEGASKFLYLFDVAPVGIVLVDPDAKILEVNTAFRQRFLVNAERGQNFLNLVDQDYRNDVRRKIADALGPNSQHGHTEIQIGSGDTRRSAQLFVSRIQESGTVSVVLYLVDITEQKNLELQFAQSQKMQAVGQLAGGIAHDFNNLLTAIIGYSDLLLGRHHAGDASFSDLHQIKQNASRAANLVRQLLAFSRQQTLKPKVISLTDMLAELNNLLRRLLGDKIDLSMVHGRNLGKIKADQGQLENVVINLAVNARDAMGPQGGSIRIRTENVSAGEARALDHAWMPPGDCVLIEFSDNGPGIPKEIIGKIFEPFFTTKEVGKGTGLGLSTAYGIIKQQGGNIYIHSEPDHGAVFKIYLPRFDEDEIEAGAEAVAETEPVDLTGKGLILLVEDEEPVRGFVSRALVGKGYTVLEADGGEMALELIRANSGKIDLMISDVMMPNMDGASLLKEIRLLDPKAKVIFISGYAEDAFRNNDEPLGDFAFLPKPFTLRQLAARVKEVMGNN
jgi:two-component system cell cycle sensor histidine kinase/response regulator CckA